MAPFLDQGAFDWHKASASADQNECVEQGLRPDGTIAVRDTAHGRVGPVLGFTAEAWTAFVGGLKDDERLTRPLP